MRHPNVEHLHFRRELTAAERLERLARRPLALHRHELRVLAERLRALDACTCSERGQLKLEEEVA